MKGLRFNNLFYNEKEDMEGFQPRCGARSLGSLPGAVILPHARLSSIRDLVAEALGCAAGLEPELVAILAPLHSPRPGRQNGKMDGAGAATTPLEEAEGETFRVRFAKLPIPYVAEDPVPFENEPSCEILYPVLARVFPGVPLLPLFALGGVSKLRRILEGIEAAAPRTLHVLSCNAAGAAPEAGRTELSSLKGLCNPLWAQALGGVWEIARARAVSGTVHMAGRRLS